MDSANQGQSVKREVIIKEEHQNLFRAFKKGYRWGLDVPADNLKEAFYDFFLNAKPEVRVKKAPRYKSEKELYNFGCNFNREGSLSGSEKKIFAALMGLSADYRWRLYLALYDLIDNFLW